MRLLSKSMATRFFNLEGNDPETEEFDTPKSMKIIFVNRRIAYQSSLSFRTKSQTEKSKRLSTEPGTHSDPSSQLVLSEVSVKSI